MFFVSEFNDGFTEVAFEVARLDVTQLNKSKLVPVILIGHESYLSVGPVKIFHKLVDRQSIGPSQVKRYDARPFLAVHV